MQREMGVYIREYNLYIVVIIILEKIYRGTSIIKGILVGI